MVTTVGNLTSTGGVGGGAGAGALAGPLIQGGITLAQAARSLGPGHKAANNFVQTYQNKLNGQLAQISALAKTDPQTAQQQLIAAVSEFMTGASQFTAQNGIPQPGGGAYNGFNSNVVQQAFNKTPDLTNTIQALWNETGGQGPFPGFAAGGLAGMASTTSPNAGGQTGQPNGFPLSEAIKLGLGALGGLGKVKGTPGFNGGAPSPTDGGGVWQGPQQGAGGSAKKPAADSKSLLSQLLPFILLGGNIFSDLYSAKTLSGAATSAANINSQAALQAMKLVQPWYDVGKSALWTESEGLGLDRATSGVPANFPQVNFARPTSATNPMLAPPPSVRY